MTNKRPDASSQSPIGRRLWWLILGRATATILLSLIGVAWKWTAFGFGSLNTGNTLAPLILTLIGLTIVYGVARITSKNYLLQVRLQFVFDIVLVTWLVWITGNAASPYAAIYIVVISVSSLFLGPRETMITSIGCAAAFTVCALFVIYARGASSEEMATIVQSVGLSDV